MQLFFRLSFKQSALHCRLVRYGTARMWANGTQAIFQFRFQAVNFERPASRHAIIPVMFCYFLPGFRLLLVWQLMRYPPEDLLGWIWLSRAGRMVGVYVVMWACLSTDPIPPKQTPSSRIINSHPSLGCLHHTKYWVLNWSIWNWLCLFVLIRIVTVSEAKVL